MDLLLQALQSGAASLASYLAAHVLLCLVPAFFVAGALSALVPAGAITRFLGPSASRWIAYPAAAGAGSLLAVCSCTVQPLFAGIYKKGAGLGPAITFLFFAPAGNLLALSYTGVALGAEFAIARVLLSLAFGIGIGLLMAAVFHRDEAARTGDPAAFEASAPVPGRTLAFVGALVGLLLAGTLKLQLFSAEIVQATLPWTGAARLQSWLDRVVPVDVAKGAEGLSMQGLVLIALLLVIALVAHRGLGRVDDGFNRLTWVTLVLVVSTLAVAALAIRVTPQGLDVRLTVRALVVLGLVAAVGLVARRFESWDVQQWLAESWRFVRMIFPLLVVGVFVVGVVRTFIRPAWIESLAGENTLLANVAGVGFGVFMYFPTLVEVPVANLFRSLGMHDGPLLAYLMSDPELSLQSILVTATIIGKRKAWAYVGFVALFATAAGLVFGAWSDGTSPWLLGPGVVAFVAAVAWVVHAVSHRTLVPA